MKNSFFLIALSFAFCIYLKADGLESQGSITFLNPTNGSTSYELTPGDHYLQINYDWTISGWATSYTVKAWIDGTLIPNPGYTHTLTYGSHTGKLELKEYDIGGSSATTVVNISFTFLPSYYIYAGNNFP